jgi:polar amino acid transport system permease protein
MTSTVRVRPRGPDRRALRSTAIAFVSTIVVFGGIAYVVVNSPGWPDVRASFFDGDIFWASLPKLIAAFLLNVVMFVTAEILVLIFGLVLALMRSLPGPVFFPIRLIATIYADVFRAVPGLLVVSLLGFGIPALGLVDPKTSPLIFGVFALTLVYSAYVSEVYRAGIDSIHPSQSMAARSLGLSHIQTLRHVVVPQAVRRVIPPLLNDFIGLQKDTVLVSYIGVVEIFRQAQISQAANFNFTPYMGVALVFLVVTIPLARFTDWLIAHDKGMRDPGGNRGRGMFQ